MQKWRLNPAMFDYYKSTSTVTDDKSRTSHKVVSVIVSAVILFAFIAFMIKQGLGSFSQMTHTNDKPDDTVLVATPTAITPETQEEVAVTPTAQENTLEQRRLYLYNQDLPPDYKIRRNDPALQVRGVIQMQNRCHAYNAYGDLMTLTPSECRQYVGTGRVYKSLQASHNAGYVTIEEAQGGVESPQTSP